MTAYLVQLLTSIGRHLVETTLVVLIAITVGALFLATGSTIPVIPLLFVTTVFLLGVASWRLHRVQMVSIATMRTLGTLDEYDRAQSEQRLRAHYEHREQRTAQRHLMQMNKLFTQAPEEQA